MRIAAYYLLSILLIAVYGGEVCPFVEKMGFWQWLAILVPHFGIGLGLRQAYVPRWVQRCEPLKQPVRQFWLDFAWFFGIATVLTVFDKLAFAFPVGSGLLVMTGILSVGLFASIDQALERERSLAKAMTLGSDGNAAGVAFAPFSRQVSVFAITCILVVAVDVILILASDMRWLSELEPGEIQSLSHIVFLEMAAVFAVLLGLILNLVLAFSKNLKMHLSNQTDVLRKVSQGQLDEQVPVFTRNEFGVIARYTNEMIDGLKERDHVKNVFGKFVSPQVASRLLSDRNAGVQLGGSRNHVAILISDIRSFTERSENCAPEQVVRDLNRYFSEMVAIVHQEGGIVDKFIGDGLLSIFGLDAPAEAEARAVRAARRMVDQLVAINRDIHPDIRIGIGVHSGEVIVGNIGSPDRLEFTVVGDAVNTAARLESLCKNLKVSVIISSSVADRLPEKLGQEWQPLGSHPLKGKRDEIEIYGWTPATEPTDATPLPS